MQCTGSLLLLFFQLPSHYFSRQKVLTQWAQPSLHSPRSHHHLFLWVPIRCLLVFKCMSRVRFLVCLFFFQLSYDFFFSPQTCVDSVGATIFTFPVVIQLNVFIAVPNQVLEKQNFLFTSFNLKEAMRFSSTHVMKMT